MRKMMKSAGVVRKVDELGRVVIPIEARRTLDIGENDSLRFMSTASIILKKPSRLCILRKRGRSRNIQR